MHINKMDGPMELLQTVTQFQRVRLIISSREGSKLDPTILEKEREDQENRNSLEQELQL